MPKMTVLAAYFGVFVLIVSVIAVGYQAPQQTGITPVASAVESPTATPTIGDKPSVDELVATDVAANLAEQTNMPVATNVANLSVSLAARSELAQTNDTAIVKPQIVQPTASSREISSYVAKAGDTATSIGAQYGISAQTVRWANNLTGDSVAVGSTLTIPPVDGIVYTVKAGDTAESLASTYSASKERIISFNDLEISGIQAGARIVIPSGSLPENMRPGYVAPRAATTTYGYGSDSSNLSTTGINFRSTSSNGYAYGYCTWYAYERRMQLGKPIGGNWGNASSWAYYAQASGFRVDSVPEVGAILQNGGGAGHVAIVEQILPDGTIVLSEMNYAGGWGRVTTGRKITQGQYQNSYYRFIH